MNFGGMGGGMGDGMGGGMGGMGGGMGGNVPGVPSFPGIWADGPNDQVLAPILDGDEIREVVAFNVPTGAWVRQALKEPARRNCAPWDGHRFAIYRAGRDLYGFSAATGRWDVLDLGDGADKDKHVGEAKGQYVVHPGGIVAPDGRVLLHRPGEFARIPHQGPTPAEYMALLRVGRLVCGFSVPRGTWDVLDLGADNDNEFPFSRAMNYVGQAPLVPRGDHLYHFNAATGNFQDIEADEPAAGKSPEDGRAAGPRPRRRWPRIEELPPAWPRGPWPRGPGHAGGNRPNGRRRIARRAGRRRSAGPRRGCRP